ncbi:Ig-like, group 2 [Candidatus Koribacter versatilis Ellin345]|uniref:Ig-like, group 2 n=1 Tax=Koribacter versatilis (strain Ellin345) TaxID=204669 RepID=Q1ISJ9_KORVE|nr:Ig-like domain-containing protein [Candidatus Koribacter versatilis]ABF40151.1 Ig-like, group 2 [Candidatus Koribacter versatilis Ellin345]
MNTSCRFVSFLSLATSLTILLASCGGNSGSTTPPPPEAAPSLTFSAAATSVADGTSTTLTWKASNADSVSIDNGIGTEPVTGSVKVTPTKTTTYTATAVHGSKSATQTVTVTVTPKGPALQSISISPASFYLRVGEKQQLKATGSFDDGSSSDITLQLTWTSASSTTAGVGEGLVTGAAAGATDITASLDGLSAKAHVAVSAAASTNVLTYHYDNTRDGAIATETTLTPANVTKSGFGKRFTYAVDGQIYAQPLYMASLKIAGATHNVVFVATENDSVYAFDADGRQTSPLWKVSIGKPETVSDPLGIKPLLGITSTPVIDAATNTMYVVARDGSKFVLHALDVTTGAEKAGSPVTVTGSVSGSGGDSKGGGITLEGGCYQRSGLVLANGNVYLAFAHCAHGWLIAYDETSLQQTAIFNSTPDGSGGTFWMSGGAGAVDAGGDIYWMTGTNFGDSQPGYNNAFLKMSRTLTIDDYFMPSNTDTLIKNDADLGSGGLVLMPDNSSGTPHEVIGGGKDGRIFVLNRDRMGEYQSTDDVLQVVQTGTQQYNNLHCTPVYWNGSLYVHSASDVIRAYGWSSSTGMLTTAATSKGSTVFGSHGATPIVSSNGNSDGILWEVEYTDYSSGGAGILHAYDATDVSKELYNSTQAGSRDTAGPAIKFTPPVVADGQVFVSTSNELDIYGLL